MSSPSSNKSSSSPILSRMNPVPVSRNSETGNPVRKSFAGNPFVKPSIIANSRGLTPKTPANSPLADYQRRNSAASRDFDEKENGKDHNPKPARVRSPTIPNGTKNFMSPTISASSKIAMSPKKKILVEKNEPVQSSLSLSHLKSSSIISAYPHEAIQPTSFYQKPIDSNNDFSSADASSDSMGLLLALRASSSIPKLSKTVTFSDCVTKHPGSLSNTTFENADAVDLADRFKISPSPMGPYPSPSSCPTLAPLDADPSMPPYDSKTNYLSPRPQFLLYRPNPRIERYLHKEGDGKSLEGSFLSESFNYSEVTEETQSESFQNSDEVSSDEFVEKVKQEKDEEEEEEEEHSLSEPSGLVGKDTIDENSEARGHCKPFNLYKISALFLLLCFGCSSVLYTAPLVKNNYPYDLYQFAKLSYPELARNFLVLSKNVVAYAHGVIWNFGEEQGIIHPVQYFNLTALREDISIDGYFVFDQSHGRLDGFPSESMKEIAVESLKPVEVEEAEEESSELDVGLNDNPSESFENSAMAGLSNANPTSSETMSNQVISVMLLLPLMAAAVYFYSRRVKTIRSNAKESKVKDLMSSSKDDRPLSRNFQAEGDMVEESCPSELSSFQKCSSYGKKGARGAGSNKAQSQEMNPRKNCRRESVSSSLDYSLSTDSPSYGSFTAYKKFSTKHSNCEEEVVTPVRRSSRIKTKLNVIDD